MRLLLSIQRLLFTTLLSVGAVPSLADCPKPDGSGGVNAPEHLNAPYIVLISLDGFRWDYPEIFNPPTINRMLKAGFRAERLIPVFPTLTFPNHYSVATGLYPDRHGLVGNHFYMPEFDSWYELFNRESVSDGRHYEGQPVWLTAECQGMVSAAYFFVGTEADIQGMRPSYWYPYDKQVPGARRVDQVLSWLGKPAAHRPHLITLYFEDVDDHSHWTGVGSGPARDAIVRVDSWLERLLQGIEKLPHGDQVNIIVVSDHGQSAYLDNAEPLVISEHIDLTGIRVIGKGPYAFLFYDSDKQARIERHTELLEAAWPHGRVMSPAEAPESWRVGTNERWPDLMLVADIGHMVVSERAQIARLSAGAHGWAPEDSDMHGILFGAGPGFIPGARIGPVRVVDIYPLMLDMLGLTAPGSLDADPQALHSVRLLKPGPTSRD